MNDSAEQSSSSTISRMSLVAMILLGGGLIFMHLTGSAVIVGLITAVNEAIMAGAIVLAAGAYGHLLLRLVAPNHASTGLGVVTACGVGLWMLSTAMLAVGTAVAGSLTGWVWWPVIAVGLLLGAWQLRKGNSHSLHIPRRLDGGALAWVPVAIAAGILLAGVTQPPGSIGLYDSYDVLEYHLQAPREFYHAGQIGQLPHNCYSYYPLGAEMLFLLAMCLRGGAYEGMYLAKMFHAVFAVLTVAGVFVALKKEDPTRGRIATGLLATSPLVVYLSSLAMVEMAQLCYLTLGLLWVRRWMRDGDSRSAVLVGMMLGAACATKYLAVGLVAAPVALAMLVFARSSSGKLLHVGGAVLVAGVLFSPWLIRNYAYTRNPVFPLATGVFGAGHWSDQSSQRWVDGHGPANLPPVPAPDDWQHDRYPTRLEQLYYNFLASDMFGPIVMIIAGVGICVLLARTGPPDPWEWSLVGVIVGQVLVWTFFTHQMPDRFMTPALAPIALIAAGALGKLASVLRSPLRRTGPPPDAPWGRLAATVIFTIAAGVNLWVCYSVHRFATDGGRGLHGIRGRDIARHVPPYNEAAQLPEGSRLLLIGDAKGFYFPPGTAYATAFDAHPLAEMIDRQLDPPEIISQLRARGITHIWMDWAETLRLAGTYGYPASLGLEVYWRRRHKHPAGLRVLDQLASAGMTVWKTLSLPTATTAPATQPAPWPWITIYALPSDPAPTTTAPQ